MGSSPTWLARHPLVFTEQALHPKTAGLQLANWPDTGKERKLQAEKETNEQWDIEQKELQRRQQIGDALASSLSILSQDGTVTSPAPVVVLGVRRHLLSSVLCMCWLPGVSNASSPTQWKECKYACTLTMFN